MEKTPGATSDKRGSALRAAKRASIEAEREEFTLWSDEGTCGGIRQEIRTSCWAPQAGNGETTGFLHTGPALKPSLGDEKVEQEECVVSSSLTEGKNTFL